eukprot:jgi/Tetstr1/450523/TSEL_037559.t1
MKVCGLGKRAFRIACYRQTRGRWQALEGLYGLNAAPSMRQPNQGIGKIMARAHIARPDRKGSTTSMLELAGCHDRGSIARADPSDADERLIEAGDIEPFELLACCGVGTLDGLSFKQVWGERGPGQILGGLFKRGPKKRLRGDHASSGNHMPSNSAASDKPLDQIGQRHTAFPDHLLGKLGSSLGSVENRAGVTANRSGRSQTGKRAANARHARDVQGLKQALAQGFVHTATKIEMEGDRLDCFPHQSRSAAFITNDPSPATRNEHFT